MFRYFLVESGCVCVKFFLVHTWVIFKCGSHKNNWSNYFRIHPHLSWYIQLALCGCHIKWLYVTSLPSLPRDYLYVCIVEYLKWIPGGVTLEWISLRGGLLLNNFIIPGWCTPWIQPHHTHTSKGISWFSLEWLFLSWILNVSIMIVWLVFSYAQDYWIVFHQ